MSITYIFNSYNKNADTFAEEIINIWQSENLFVKPSLLEIKNDDEIISKKLFFKILGELKRNKYYLNLAIENSAEIKELYNEPNEILVKLENLKPALRAELKFVALQLLNLEDEIRHLKESHFFFEK